MESLPHIGFLGIGKMGRSIAGGILREHPGQTMSAFDPAPGAVEAVRAELGDGINFVRSAAELERAADILILAVKPQDMAAALGELSGGKKYVSIAAGLSTDTLRRSFPEHLNEGARQNLQISRVMPNISALVGAGVCGIFCENDELFGLTERIFSPTGSVVRLKSEQLMHAVTGLSGSGPAYVFAFIQALAEGGVLAGLPYDSALELARATVAGAAELLRSTGEHPDEWRNRVTSPGGTTIAGLAELEDAGFHGAVMRAVERAAERSRELSGESS